MDLKQKKSMSAAARSKSFSYAFNGIWLLLTGEPNVKIHALATVAAIVAGVMRHISNTAWVALAFAIGLVWITEALNTCIERLCDFCCENKFHPAIKVIKDIAAAAVLIAALTSITIAIIIFFF